MRNLYKEEKWVACAIVALLAGFVTIGASHYIIGGIVVLISTTILCGLALLGGIQ